MSSRGRLGAPTGEGPQASRAAPVLSLASDGPDATRALAAALAPVLHDGDLLVLTGDLGAGKTCFAQGLGAGLGVEERITSPTFTLASRYRGRLVLNHLDVYRLESVAESLDLGLAELLEDGVTVIEWGDRIAEVLPVDHLVVSLRYPEPADGPVDARLIDVTICAGERTGWGDRLPALRAVLGPWLADPLAGRGPGGSGR